MSCLLFFFSSSRRHTRCCRDWSSDVCSSDLEAGGGSEPVALPGRLLALRTVRGPGDRGPAAHRLGGGGGVAVRAAAGVGRRRSEEHTSELQSRLHLVCRLLLEKKK